MTLISSVRHQWKLILPMTCRLSGNTKILTMWILSCSAIVALLLPSSVAFVPGQPSLIPNGDLITLNAELSRRDVLGWTAGSLLSSVLLGNAAPGQAESPQTILLTGGNSGIGYEAALKLATAGHTILLPCRTIDKSVNAIKSIEGTGLVTGKLIPAECDLANLASIDAFVNEVPSLLGSGESLDTVCFNAGLARNAGAKEIVRSADGFEVTGTVYHAKDTAQIDPS